HASAGNASYQYQFDRAAPGREAAGATHGAELPYVFGTLGPRHVAVDHDISNAIQTYWTNFVTTGDPNGSSLPQWPRFAAPAGGADSVEKLPVMKTQRFGFDEIPVTTNGKNKQRRMFTAKTHTGFKIESHQSDIAPGEVNHLPHQHLREEMMLIREGVMEL